MTICDKALDEPTAERPEVTHYCGEPAGHPQPHVCPICRCTWNEPEGASGPQPEEERDPHSREDVLAKLAEYGYFPGGRDEREDSRP